MAVSSPTDTDTYNFILIRKGELDGKPLPIQGSLVEAEVLAMHLLRPGESLCAVFPDDGKVVCRWEASDTGNVSRSANRAA